MEFLYQLPTPQLPFLHKFIFHPLRSIFSWFPHHSNFLFLHFCALRAIVDSLKFHVREADKRDSQVMALGS